MFSMQITTSSNRWNDFEASLYDWFDQGSMK